MITESNIVVVLQDVQPIEEVDRSLLAQYMTGPIDIGAAPGGLSISSLPAQLEVLIGAQRLTIRSYRTMPAPEIVNFALALCEALQARIRSLGFNFKLRVEPPEADWVPEDIVKAYLNLEALQTALGASVTNATLRLQFPGDFWRVQIDLGTDGEKALLVDLNFHFGIEDEVTTAETPAEIRERRDWTTEFQARYDECEGIARQIVHRSLGRLVDEGIGL